MLENTTELEAVNLILASVGESPVVALDDNFVDAKMAQDLLRQESRRVQQAGWTFNTDINVTLTPDINGNVFVPANLLRFNHSNRDLVVRGLKLYDRYNQTYVFTDPVTEAELVTCLDFEDCPEALREFVVIRAGRRFQDRYQGDESLHRFQAADETAAWAALLNYEAEIAGWNMLNASPLNTRMKRFRNFGSNVSGDR